MRLHRPERITSVIFLLFAGSLLTLSLYWSELMIYISNEQRELHKMLSDHIVQVSSQSQWFSLGLALLCFGYGVFHAIGPGHGKAIIITYMGTQQASVKRGVLLSIAASALQATVAVALVIALGQILKFSFTQVNDIGTQVTNIGYGLLGLLGLYICVRSAIGLRKQRLSTPPMQVESNHGHEHDEHGDCHHIVESNPEDSIAQQLGLILSMGLRPCTGALIVLTYAVLVDALVAGIIATYTMALGTSIAIASIALATVFARDYLKARLEKSSIHDGNTGTHHRFGSYLQLLGGIILSAFGFSLLNTAIQLQNDHPLF